VFGKKDDVAVAVHADKITTLHGIRIESSRFEENSQNSLKPIVPSDRFPITN